MPNRSRETANIVSRKTGIAVTIPGDPIILGVGNTELVRITGSGSVGIGTTNPGAKLHVQGNVRLGGDSNWGLELVGSTFQIIDRTSNIRRGIFNTSGDVFLGGPISNDLGTSAVLSVISGGNIGIGVTSASTKLDILHTVVGAAATTIRVNNTTNGTTGNGIALQSNSTNVAYFGWDYTNSIFNTNVSSYGNIIFSTNGSSPTEKVRITTTGDVGIGTTNPGDKLTVLGRVHIQQDATSYNRIIFRATPSSSYRWNIDNFGASNLFRIYREDDATAANGAVAIEINAATRNVSLYGGNLAFDSGKGIDFSATANGSGTMTSELLSDYEEGTWTPTLGYAVPGTSSFTYTYNTGWYCKVGTLVHVTWDIRLSAFTKGTASGVLSVAGFPFASINSSDYARANQVVFLYQWPYATTAGYIPFVSMKQTSSTFAELSFSVSNSVSAQMSDPDSDSMMFGALTYRSS